MVALSLYRGNLHRVPDVPRRWLMPAARISFKDFKTLLNRRNRALSRLRQHSLAAGNAITSNPNSNCKQEDEAVKPNGSSLQVQLDEGKEGNCREEERNVKNEEIMDRGKLDDGDRSEKPEPVDDAEVAAVFKVDGDEKLQSLDVVEKAAEPVETADPASNPNVQTSKKSDVVYGKEKRKKEIEEKLETLNAKKHNLVQALKQLLNAEEELKRSNCTQGMVIRPTGPLQVDVTSESGLMARQTTPRTGSEANLVGDTEGAEAEDASNQNAHSRHMLRMSSMSPSSESPIRRPTILQHNVVPHPSRASLAVTGSPSRFAPPGHQGNSGNLPTVCVSGTNYVASSPSPAASGGTSVFRDA
ncbi:hypothetical protein AB3S75_029037 [Citrus x aurantiifolia]